MARQARRFAALCTWAVSIAAAQGPLHEARRLNNDAAALYAQGNIEAAERLYRAALTLSANDHLLAATMASNLGALYKQSNRLLEAEQQYKQALDLRRQSLTSVRPEIAYSMNNLAEVYRLEGRYWEARNLEEAAVRALEQADPQNPDMPLFLNNWAGLERDLQHLGRAEQLLQQARPLAEKSGDRAGNSLAIVLNTLAQVRTDKRQYVEAERLYLQAGAIFEKANRPYELAVTWANLGRAQMLLGRSAEARQTELRALALLNTEVHPDELLRAAILHNLGNVATADGDILDALSYLDSALRTQERILGPRHPSLADVLFDYAAVESQAGEKSQARKMHKRAKLLAAARQQDDLSRQIIDASAFVHSR